MKFKWLESIIPPQQKGRHTTTASHTRCNNEYVARERFSVAARRLLEVNKWHEYAGRGTAVFQLTNDQGEPVNRPAQTGDYFCIDIPGPANPAGDGRDWVQVQTTGHKTIGKREVAWLTVRAGLHPGSTEKEPAHFFDHAATSTFVVYKENLLVAALVFGRNERANVKKPGLLASLRNLIMYIGAILGFSKLQWKKLTRGLLKKDILF